MYWLKQTEPRLLLSSSLRGIFEEVTLLVLPQLFSHSSFFSVFHCNEVANLSYQPLQNFSFSFHFQICRLLVLFCRLCLFLIGAVLSSSQLRHLAHQPHWSCQSFQPSSLCQEQFLVVSKIQDLAAILRFSHLSVQPLSSGCFQD